MLEIHDHKKVESILSFYLEEEISNAQPCILLPLWIDYVHNENYSTFVTQCSDNLCNRIRYWTANGRTVLEEIKCLLMRALTADPLSVRVVNFEVFLEDFFHCHFSLKGQAIVLTYREKNKTEKTFSTKTSKFIWCNSQSSRLHYLLLSACQKLSVFQVHWRQTVSALGWIGWQALLRGQPGDFSSKRSDSLFSNGNCSSWAWCENHSALLTQCWKVLTVPASSSALVHYLGRTAALRAQRSPPSGHLCLTLPLICSAHGTSAPTHCHINT